LLGGPPGVELHSTVDAVPSGDAGDMVPVVLPTIGVGMVPKGAAGIITDVETGFSAGDDAGTGTAVMEGNR
jgi:hypothetical protein